MSRVVFDIETIGNNFDNFDEVRKTYLLKFADTEEKILEAKRNLSLSPLTAEVICIALLNPDTEKGTVLYQSDLKESFKSDDDKIEFTSGDEEFILTEFWKLIKHFNQYITFNGRGFDAPFLILRSALLNIPISKNLMPYRYDTKPHCDLLDQLTFYGVTRKYNLDFYCKSFGIESPKSHGITGLDLSEYFFNKKFKDIANYCLGDVIATASLFKIFEERILNIKPENNNF